MSNFETAFPEAFPSLQEMQQDLEQIAQYYHHMDIEATVVGEDAQLELPLLVALLSREGEDGAPPRMVSHSFQPMDQEQVQATKYMQMYGEISLDGLSISRLDLLGLVNACNIYSQSPTALLRTIDGKTVLAMRLVVGISVGKTMEFEEFLDMIGLFDVFSGMMELFLEQLAQGKTMEEAKEIILNHS